MFYVLGAQGWAHHSLFPAVVTTRAGQVLQGLSKRKLSRGLGTREGGGRHSHVSDHGFPSHMPEA
jgi:hypothetical protein